MGRSFHHTSRSLINKYTHSLAEEGSKEEGSTQTHSLVVLASRKHKSSNRENIQPKHLSYHIRDGNVIGYPSLGTLYLSLQYIRRLSSQPLVCENSNHFHSTHLLERTIHIFTMLFTRQIVTLAIALLGMSSMVAATPVERAPPEPTKKPAPMEPPIAIICR